MIASRSTVNSPALVGQVLRVYRIRLAASARNRSSTFIPMVHGRLTRSTRRSKITGGPRTRYFYLQIAVLSVLVISCLPIAERRVDVARPREKVARVERNGDSIAERKRSRLERFDRNNYTNRQLHPTDNYRLSFRGSWKIARSACNCVKSEIQSRKNPKHSKVS